MKRALGIVAILVLTAASGGEQLDAVDDVVLDYDGVGPVSIDVLANDVDGPNGPASISAIAFREGEAYVDQNGTTDPTDDFIVFSGDAEECGVLVLFYEIADQAGLTDRAEVKFGDSDEPSQNNSNSAFFAQVDCGAQPSFVSPAKANAPPPQQQQTTTGPTTTAGRLQTSTSSSQAPGAETTEPAPPPPVGIGGAQATSAQAPASDPVGQRPQDSQPGGQSQVTSPTSGGTDATASPTTRGSASGGPRSSVAAAPAQPSSDTSAPTGLIIAVVAIGALAVGAILVSTVRRLRP